jgi:hypothetical protein
MVRGGADTGMGPQILGNAGGTGSTGRGGVMATTKSTDFAFPKQRKEPLTDARHVRNAIARFDQVEGVSDADRDLAWKRIIAAAKHYDIDVSEKDWRDLFSHGKAPKR